MDVPKTVDGSIADRVGRQVGGDGLNVVQDPVIRRFVGEEEFLVARMLIVDPFGEWTGASGQTFVHPDLEPN